MSPTKIDEKIRLQLGAIKEFSALFSERVGRGRLMFIEHMSPPYPDLKCRLDDEQVYIEVAHAYGTDVDVRKVLRRGTTAEPGAEEDLKNTVALNMDNRIVEPINGAIKKHCYRDYAGFPRWLLVRVGNFLYDVSEFEHLVERLVVPSNNKFDEIWILCGPRKECGAIQIWPKT